MRRHLIIAAVTSAVLVGGCGDDTSDTVDQAQTQGQEAVQEGGQRAEELLRDTQDVAMDVTRSARELAEDPSADLDAELEDAEQRARDLAAQAENELSEDQDQLASAISDANERLADAAADLREEDPRATASRVIEEDLPQATERLAEGVRAQGSQEAREAQERLRDGIEQLERDLPDIGG